MLRTVMSITPPGSRSKRKIPVKIQALEKYGDAHEADWPYEEPKLAEKPPVKAYDCGSVNQVASAGYL